MYISHEWKLNTIGIGLFGLAIGGGIASMMHRSELTGAIIGGLLGALGGLFYSTFK